MSRPFKIALACGGTGGHIFPGLATAHVLRERGHDVEIYLAGKDIEADAVAGWEGTKYVVKAQGFQSKNPFAILKTLYGLRLARKRCRKLMKKQKPDVLLGMGSYACVGPARAAFGLDVPVVLHEANVVPGRAVSHLARDASAVAAFFDETSHYLQKSDLKITGMPIRPELWTAAQKAATRGKDAGRPFTLLVMGGSRGSTPLNRLVSTSLIELARIRQDFFVIHLTGHKDEPMIRDLYERHSIPAKVSAFTSDMASIYRAADLTICRSGAASCAELMAFGVPSLLVPLPHAVRDHQTFNAKAMERIGCADFVPESDLDSTWLTEYIDGCMHTPDRLNRMTEAARRRAQVSGAERLADLVVKIAEDYVG